MFPACKDCIYIKTSYDGDWLCGRPREATEFNPYTGEHEPPSPFDIYAERVYMDGEDRCGVGGQFYEESK